MEHLPRRAGTYRATPVVFDDAKAWLSSADLNSLIRTSEMIGAIEAGFGLKLEPAAKLMAIAPGDEALLVTLSFSVLLAWSQGGIVPLREDWRCLLLSVGPPAEPAPSPRMAHEGLTPETA